MKVYNPKIADFVYQVMFYEWNFKTTINSTVIDSLNTSISAGLWMKKFKNWFACIYKQASLYAYTVHAWLIEFNVIQ